MGIPYNIDFLVAAIVFLTFVLVHFLSGRKLGDTPSSRMFLVIVAVGAADIVIEIACTAMMADPLAYSIALLYVYNTAFYVLQCSLPFLLFLYAALLCKKLSLRNATAVVVACVPFAIFVLLCATNPWTNLLFYFDQATHAYTPGPLYVSMFVYAVLYAFAAIAYAFAHRAILRTIDLLAMCEFVVILCVCVVLQYILDNVLLTGFGIGLGIMVLFLTINNPFEFIDPLTGAFETTRFRRKAASLIKARKQFGVVYVSLDYLQRLNAVVGPEFADETVRSCARFFATVDHDLPIYRLRESLFAFILRTPREQQAIMGKIEAFFAEKHVQNGVALELDASVGLVSNACEFRSGDELQAYIDHVVDNLHRKGSLPSAADEPAVIAAFRRTEDIRRYLDSAVRDDLFDVYLQPLYSLKKKQFVGVEVLARLFHPEGGAISPAEFMHVAEDEGRISDIGRLQFEKVCRYLAENRSEFAQSGLRTVKVNVSPVELLNPDLGTFLLSTMERWEIDPALFQFEITETSATQYNDELHHLTDRLLQAGSGLCMDDFGSGYANFSSIMGVPFNVVKLDITLLQDAVADERSGVLYRGILRMMEDLGFEVVCEGVETAEQAALLESWGADTVQGYHFARPMPAIDVLSFVAAGGYGEEA